MDGLHCLRSAEERLGALLRNRTVALVHTKNSPGRWCPQRPGIRPLTYPVGRQT